MPPDLSREGRAACLPAQVEHLLLTRFNVPHPAYVRDKHGAVVADDAWLEHRFELFEKFTLPSVRSQREARFRWLICFAARTPESYRRRIARDQEIFPFTPLFVDTFADLIPQVRAQVNPATEFLITSRLDNDDALCVDALGAIAAAFHEQAFEFVHLATGYIYSHGTIYSARLPDGPFLTLIERRSPQPWRTVWSTDHDRVRELGPVRDLEARPYWLQVVHERNLRNDWGDRWVHAWQPLKNHVRRILARLRLLPLHRGWIERTTLAPADLRGDFAIRL